MKKLAIVLVVVMALALSASAENGATKMKPVLYVGGGLGMPISPDFYKDYWKMGIGFGGGLGVQINPSLEVIGKFYYNSFGADWDAIFGPLASLVTIEGLDFQVMEFGADVKYLFNAKAGTPFAPFLVLGVGASSVSFSDVTVSAEGVEEVTVPSGIDESAISLSAGVGFDYMFSPKAGIWVETRYMMIATEGESTAYLPIRVGLKVLFGE